MINPRRSLLPHHRLPYRHRPPNLPQRQRQCQCQRRPLRHRLPRQRRHPRRSPLLPRPAQWSTRQIQRPQRWATCRTRRPRGTRSMSQAQHAPTARFSAVRRAIPLGHAHCTLASTSPRLAGARATPRRPDGAGLRIEPPFLALGSPARGFKEVAIQSRPSSLNRPVLEEAPALERWSHGQVEEVFTRST